MGQKIEGVLTAIVTTFDHDGAYQPEAMELQIRRQVAAGNGIFCGGTNGEFFVLNKQEKLAITETCVNEVAGKAPVVAHIGEISTRETIRLGRQVAKMGVDAVSVITPYFVPLKQEELIWHYRAVADALDIPVFMYNIPARTGNTLQPETVRKLAEHPNIFGIKDSAGSYESLKGFLDAAAGIENFNVLNGPDSLIHRGFIEGCSACISGLANVVPEGINAIWHHFRTGDIAASYAAQEIITNLRTELYSIAFSPAIVKKVLAIMGHDVGESRYAVRFNKQAEQKIHDVITRYFL